MFATPQNSPSRQRSASHSTDDNSKDKPRRFFRRYARDLSLSSQSLAIAGPHHDDLPTPSVPVHASQATSAQSTPMTSPSIAHSSLLHGSLSSATSESGPSPDSKFRSEFGFLTCGSVARSPIRGSASSRSSHPVSPRSRSTTESDIQVSSPQLPRKCSSSQLSNRPSTTPYSPSVPTTPTAADSFPAEGHTRTPSRLTVSIKNLLARPIIPSPSRFSFNSVITPSDSDASSRSHRVPASGGKWSMTPRKSRPPDLNTSASVGVAMPSPSHSFNPQIDAHRRYASEAVAKIYSARTGSISGPPRSLESFGVPVQNESPPPVRGREQKPRNVLRRRPSGSARFSKARERGMSIATHPPDSNLPKEGTSQFGPVPPLTPAGAVAEAYKQQELRRDDTTNLPNLSSDHRMSAGASRDSEYDGEHLDHSPTPYYTVFGTFSGRRVRAGGPDDRWCRFEAHPLGWNGSEDPPAREANASDLGARSLTRKVSSSWRKIKGGGVAWEKSPVRGRGHSKGRGSLQELWGGGERTSARVTGRSIDGISNPGDGAWASPTAGHARTGSEKGDESSGGKFWRLMRRISTGGLRDRYQSEQVVPPVPAIPKELLKKVNQDEHHRDLLSMSPSIPSSDSHDKDHTQTFSAPKNMTDAQPSVATSSSSPNSSDVASIQFFPKPLSTRSSVSSYGEPIPRTSAISLDQHIIAPLEQLRLGDDHARSSRSCTSSMPSARSPRRSVSVPAGLRSTEDGEGDQVPLPPPRRLTCSGESPPPVSSSTSSASASGSTSARASCQSQGVGAGRSRMEDGIASLSPPPRAQRSARRGGVEESATSSHSIFVKQVEGGVRQMDRTPSARSDMTARKESPEPRRSRDQDTSPRTRAQLTFRELDAPRRPPLSEREKADIWDDLLARSDKAGGTLHINGAAELMSDNLRFSMHSEI